MESDFLWVMPTSSSKLERREKSFFSTFTVYHYKQLSGINPTPREWRGIHERQPEMIMMIFFCGTESLSQETRWRENYFIFFHRHYEFRNGFTLQSISGYKPSYSALSDYNFKERDRFFHCIGPEYIEN
jgi:hypothetical protein